VSGRHEIRHLPAATRSEHRRHGGHPPSARRPESACRANWTPGKPTETITLRDGLGSSKRMTQARR